MKKRVLVFVLLLSISLFSQEKIVLSNVNNLEISYTLQRIDRTANKDVYLIIINYVNNNDFDLYYEDPVKHLKGGGFKYSSWIIGFAKIKVRNTAGVFGDGQSLYNDSNKSMKTATGVLATIKKGVVYTFEETFRVDINEKPIITITSNFEVKKIEDFRLILNNHIIRGNWVSECSKKIFTLAFKNGGNDIKGLLQVIDGKTIKWKKEGVYSYSRKGLKREKLTYDEKTQTFTFSSPGETCKWVKS